MTEYKNYDYGSDLAPYIHELIAEKRKLGFIYNLQAYQLKRFDDYFSTHKYTTACVTADMLQEWLCYLPNESNSSHRGRVSAVKSLMVYMNILGIPCHVPLIMGMKTRDHTHVHILSHQEIAELFSAIDSYIPTSLNRSDLRMANEYPLMYRLYYCCGMRNNEVCSLAAADIALDTGILTVRDGKNHKNRLVYMPEELRLLAGKYFCYIKRILGYEPFWFFPGRCPDKHVSKTQTDKKFSIFWNWTASSKHCDKKPTPHCLRHTYVVDRINKWVLEGIDLNVMMVYLSKYLGHTGPDESFYYYHMVDEAFQIIRQKDSVADTVIPEVRRR